MAPESALAPEVLTVVLQLLFYPGLVIAVLLVAAPVVRREPVTDRRCRAARVLAVVALTAVVPLLVLMWALGWFGVMLLVRLIVPAVLTLTRLPGVPPAPLEGAPPRL